MTQQAIAARRPVGVTSRPDISPIRFQAALIRTLLDEVDACAPPAGAASEVVEQVADELRRLGREALRLAAAIEQCDAATPPGPF